MRVFITIAVTFLTFQSATAQVVQKVKTSQAIKDFGQAGRHSINVEILGRTFIFGSINYEYSLNKNASLGLGLGLISILGGDITRNNNGAPEEGRYLDMGSTQMIYGNYFIGKRKHKAYFTGGLTNFLITSRNTYQSETKLSRDFELDWNAGLGYQYTGLQTFYRLTAYVIGLPGPSAWFPKYMPWIGLSVGYRI